MATKAAKKSDPKETEDQKYDKALAKSFGLHQKAVETLKQIYGEALCTTKQAFTSNSTKTGQKLVTTFSDIATGEAIIQLNNGFSRGENFTIGGLVLQTFRQHSDDVSYHVLRHNEFVGLATSLVSQLGHHGYDSIVIGSSYGEKGLTVRTTIGIPFQD